MLVGGVSMLAARACFSLEKATRKNTTRMCKFSWEQGIEGQSIYLKRNVFPAFFLKFCSVCITLISKDAQLSQEPHGRPHGTSETAYIKGKISRGNVQTKDPQFNFPSECFESKYLKRKFPSDISKRKFRNEGSQTTFSKRKTANAIS